MGGNDLRGVCPACGGTRREGEPPCKRCELKAAREQKEEKNA